MTSLDRRQLLAAGLGAGAAALTSPGLAASAVVPPAKFRLGLVTWNIGSAWELPTLLNVCKDAGLAAVEFRTTHKHGVEPALSKQERKEIKKRCADAGVVISSCGSICEFQSPSETVVRTNIETCKKFIDLVADLGGRGVKVRPNSLIKDEPEERTLERIGKALRECGKAAEDAGVEIQVEVHGPGTAEPSRMKVIMEQCGHKAVGITWNSNPQDIKNGSVAESFRMLKPWLRNCHINQLWKDATGGYPYRELFRLLREDGYDRWTLIEINPSIPDRGIATEFLRYYKGLWTELCRGD